MRFNKPHIRLPFRNGERFGSRLARARYFRGHGVHSPFVYAVVRQVFMARRLRNDDRRLYEALRACRVPERRAVQLQNLFDYCGFAAFGIDRAEHPAENSLQILTAGFPAERLHEAADAARTARAALCILEPYADRKRCDLCTELTAAHRSTSIDNRAYLLLFNNHLPKQHFKL